MISCDSRKDTDCEGVTLLSEGEPHSICSSAFLPLGVSWFSAHCYAVDYE